MSDQGKLAYDASGHTFIIFLDTLQISTNSIALELVLSPGRVNFWMIDLKTFGSSTSLG